jgi:hypothetical protein
MLLLLAGRGVINTAIITVFPAFLRYRRWVRCGILNHDENTLYTTFLAASGCTLTPCATSIPSRAITTIATSWCLPTRETGLETGVLARKKANRNSTARFTAPAAAHSRTVVAVTTFAAGCTGTSGGLCNPVVVAARQTMNTVASGYPIRQDVLQTW